MIKVKYKNRVKSQNGKTKKMEEVLVYLVADCDKGY